MGVEFGHVVEIHAVDAGDEGEGEEDSADGGEDLHDLVEALAEDGLVVFPDAGDGFAEVVGGFDGAPGVVVEVTQEGGEGGGGEAAFVVLEADGDFAEGAEEAVNEIGVGAQLVDFGEVDAGVGEGEGFVEAGDFFFEVVEGDEVVVEEGVEEGPGEVVGALEAEAAFALAEAEEDGVEDGGGGFLEAEEDALGEDEAEVLDFEAVVGGGGAAGEDFGGDEEVVAEVLEFGALVGVEDIVLDEGVDVVGIEDAADASGVVESGGADPGGAIGAFEGEALGAVEDGLFADLMVAVVEHGDGDLGDAAFADEGAGAGDGGGGAGVAPVAVAAGFGGGSHEAKGARGGAGGD